MPEIYFAQIREDSLVERTLAAKRRPRQIACIGSGGCTALSLLADGVERVYAIDANAAQCALLELKKEAVRALDRPAYLAFIGESEADDRLETYRRIAGGLPAYARVFWESHESDIALGINQCGATEKFYRFVGGRLRNGVCDDRVFHELFDCGTLARQRALYDRHFTTDAWKDALRVLLSRTTHLLFFPAFMFAQATEDDMGAFFARQFEKEVRERPLANNYFLSQILFSAYRFGRPEGAPHYLSDDGYAAARRNIDALAVVPGTLQEFLPQTQGIDAFFLSNVFDWSSPEARSQICAALLEAASTGAVLLYRHMLSAHALPEFFARRFRTSADANARLLRLERSMLYQQVVAGEIA
jgi:S-adenosylmethionine-diacylglycerol 3-amino-3-carboxypropyl transferase